jgi:hypothetical protein
MITSENKVPDEYNIDFLKAKILQIGSGELGIWKLAVISDKIVFKQIYSLIMSADPKIAWRCGWIIDNATENYPELLIPYIPDIIAQLTLTQNGSLKRIYTRMLSRHEIPEELLVQVVDRCFELLSPVEPIAVRVNAMQVLFNISQREQGFKQELTAVLEGLLEEGGSAGFINRTEKLLRKLNSANDA